MKFSKHRYFTLLFLILTTSITSSCYKKDNKDSLGKITFEVSGSKEALPFYEKGMLLLHSFEYQDAAENFSKARTIDPSFVMAYWGEAMTYNHSLWRMQDYEKADSVLNLLSKDPAERMKKAPLEMEKDFIKGINILYGKGSKIQRDQLYVDYMAKLYKKYPGNDEVAAFYSIALIGSVPVGRDEKIYGHAAEIAKEVLTRNPKHPGALHYLIHAYDDPTHAKLALNTADAYAIVAPSAAHALHMPTHIYLALGMWDKVISSNIASWQASEKRLKRKKLTVADHNYHAFYWLMYGYLQKENKEAAKDILKRMQKYEEIKPSDLAREYMIGVKGTYLVETDDWHKEIVDISVDQSDLNIAIRAMNYFVKGMYCYKNKDSEGLEKVIDQFEGEIMVDKEKVTSNSIKMCGNVNSNMPNELDLQQADVMKLELRALQALLQEKEMEAEGFMKEASALESKVSYAFGPPPIVKPSFELYGEWLLGKKRFKEAVQQFDLSLKAAPNRLLSVRGKKIANEFLKSMKVTGL